MALREELHKFVEETLLRGEQKVGVEDSLIDGGLIDSIGLIQLTSFLEERTGIRVPDDQVTAENFQSISAIEKMMEGLKS